MTDDPKKAAEAPIKGQDDSSDVLEPDQVVFDAAETAFMIVKADEEDAAG